MTKAEAAALVAILVAAFPGVRFAEENAVAYETGIADLEPSEAQNAVNELVKTSRFLPSVADIRYEVFRIRKLLRDSKASKLSLERGDGRLLGPRPEQWSKTLLDISDAGKRWKEMAAPWYAARGRLCPRDPAQPFIDLAQAGARGEDVRSRFNREVLHEDESEKRYP